MEGLTGDELTDKLVPVAVRLVGAVREFDAEEVEAALSEAEAIGCNVRGVFRDTGLKGLLVVLAAMVPYDATPRELLRWLNYRDEFRRLVALGIDPAAAATIINNTLRRGDGRPD